MNPGFPELMWSGSVRMPIGIIPNPRNRGQEREGEQGERRGSDIHAV